MACFKNIKLGDLFDKVSTKTLKYTMKSLPTEKTATNPLPATTCGKSNQGLTCYVPRDGATVLKGLISMSGNGDAAVYFQPFDFTILQDSYAIKYKDKDLSENESLYFVEAINKAIKHLDWNTKPGWERVKEYEIQVPVVDGSNCPDFEYMTATIARVKKLRFDAFNKFLSENDLSDYTLTDEDKATLNEKKVMAEFPIDSDIPGGIFTVKNTHSILKSDIKRKGKTPYVTAKAGNNSVADYISFNLDCIEDGNCISIGGKTMVVTYQANDYFSNDSHNLALYINDESGRTEKAQLYMVQAIKNCLSHKYTWNDSISKDKIKEDTIYLPVDTDGNIDFNYMERYIAAIEKIVVSKAVGEKKTIVEEQTNKVTVNINGTDHKAKIIHPEFINDINELWKDVICSNNDKNERLTSYSVAKVKSYRYEDADETSIFPRHFVYAFDIPFSDYAKAIEDSRTDKNTESTKDAILKADKDETYILYELIDER